MEPTQENEAKVLAARKQLKEDYLATFSTDAGKRVLTDLANRCFAGRTSFNGDAYQTVFNEGRRSIYIHIVGTMNLDLERLAQPKKEDTNV